MMDFVKKVKKDLSSFYFSNKLEFYLLFLIIGLAAFLRLYRIGEYMTFLGDEGRDAIVVWRLFAKGDFFLIGPGTSIGNMYLGPMYYYMMAPFLFLANFSPVGPAVGVALLGVLTTWFVWFVSREWFGKRSSGRKVHFSSLGAAFLYAIAPTVIIYSRSSWNPNIMPFFALLCVYSIWRVAINKSFKWLWVLGFSFAAVLQSHYLGLLLAPLLGLFWFFVLFNLWRHKKNKIKPFIFNSLISLAIFIILMSPLVIFDSRHGWRNFEAIKVFFTQRQTTISARPWTAFPDIYPMFENIVTRVLAGRNEEFGAWVAFFVILGLLWILTKSRKLLDSRRKVAFSILFFWIFFALIGFGVYKQHIYDHYFGFVFPSVFILFAGLSSTIVRHARLRGSWLAFTFFVFLSFYNLLDVPVRYPPNRQMQTSIEVANKIIEESKEEPFNLAVIAERNYEDAYKYFLLKQKAPVVEIEPQDTESTITDQLFVVCELPETECGPTTNPKTEIANFGWSRVSDKWNVSGVWLYRLVHKLE